MLHLSYFLLIILFQLPIFSYSYTFEGYQIRDLEFNGSNFAQEAAAWSIPASKLKYGTKIGTCGQYTLIGGSMTVAAWTVFTRVYDDLPSHNTIYYTLHIWLIDSWDSGDTFSIKFDSTTLPFWNSIQHNQFIWGNVCGSSYPDIVNLEISGQIPHNQSSLTVQVVSGLNGDTNDESIAFRDFTFLFATTASPTSSYCSNMTIPNQNYTCSCATGKYPDANNICQNCDPSCQTCFGSSSSECYTCKIGYFYNGEYCQPCDSSCKDCYGSGSNQCTRCNSGYSLILNTTCIASCPSWFGTSSDAFTQYCDAICPNSGYIDMTAGYACKGSCNVPYTVSKQGRYKLCVQICSDLEYYYLPTYGCVKTCPNYYYGDDTSLLCEACQDSLCEQCSDTSGQTCKKCQEGVAILNENSVCKECEEMQIEYIKSTDTGSEFYLTLSPETCDLTLSFVKSNLAATKQSKDNFPSFTFEVDKTKTSRQYLLTITLKDTLLESSGLNFTLSYLNDIAVLPKQYIPSSTLAALAAAAPTAATMLTGTFGASFAGTLSLGATAALWSMLNYQQFIGNLIYVNIDYPVQLELFLSLLQSVGLELLPNPMTKLSNKIDEYFPSFKGDINAAQYDPPAKFLKYEKTSFFIENGGTSFAMNFCFFALMGLIPLIMKIRRFPGHSKLFRFALQLRWNINARSFLENGIPIALSFFLQVQKATFATPYNLISLIFAIMAFFYFLLMTDFLLKSLTSNSLSKLKDPFTEAKFGTLYEGIKLKSSIAKYYHFLILFRGVILSFLVTFFEDWPVFQVVPLVFYNILLTILLFKGIEFTDSKLLLINRVKEIFITVGLCGIIGLNLPDASEEYYDMLGWLVVSVFIVSFLTEFFYTIGLQIMELRNLYHKFRRGSHKQKVKRRLTTTTATQSQKTLESGNSHIITSGNDLSSTLNESHVALTNPPKFKIKRRRLSSGIFLR